MSLREYYSDNLGMCYVVDHIRITDKAPKRKAAFEFESETGKRVYRKPDEARLVKKGGK